jgi:RNA polymerase-binding transcription factor DksA
VVNVSSPRFEIDRVEVRSRLTAIADTLELRQDALAATPEAIGEEVLDEMDRAQRVSQERFTEALESAMSRARAQLAHAIAIVDAGGYGICESFGCRISEARLAFRPESTRCLPCQAVADLRGGSEFID